MASEQKKAIKQLFGPHAASAVEACVSIIRAYNEAREKGADPVTVLARPKESDVLAASKIILEYVYGKPVQLIGGSQGEPIQHIVTIIDK